MKPECSAVTVVVRPEPTLKCSVVSPEASLLGSGLSRGLQGFGCGRSASGQAANFSLERFQLIRLISCCGEEVGALVGCDGVDEAPDGRPNSLDGPFLSFAQQRF